MKYHSLITILVLFSLHVVCQDSFVDSIRTKYKIPGLTYAVFNADSILEMGALGKRRVDGDSSVKITDRFHIGSNTKAVTAFLAAKLVDEKKIQWDTKFFDLFPEFRSASNEAYREITLQDLLCHRAHIQPYRSVNSNNEMYKMEGSSIEQKRKFASIILKDKPACPDSGHVYVYSNAGYTLAASMLEKVAKKSWEELVREYLNGQLKIGFETGFPNVNDPDQPWGHILNNDTIMALPPDFDYHIATIMRPDFVPHGTKEINLPDKNSIPVMPSGINYWQHPSVPQIL